MTETELEIAELEGCLRAQMARAELAEAILLDALRFNNEGQKAAQLAEEDASGLASLLQDSNAMRRSLRARAEQAERERDGARELAADRGKEALEAIAAYDAEKAARERSEAVANSWAERGQEAEARALRAEADNAALLRDIDTVGHMLGSGEVAIAVSVLSRSVSTSHPGATLLAEVEALRQVREALGSGPLLDGVTDLNYSGPDLLSLRRACVAADALKVTR